MSVEGVTKRVFVVVMDSFGIGAAPDWEKFDDEAGNTIASCAASAKFSADNLAKLGIFNIDGVDCRPAVNSPIGAYGRLYELSMGKDTTIGHWEIAGHISPEPLPTYPNGFPESVIKEFERATGRGVLCNKPYSGTQVIHDYGREHIETGKLIVYTSADSVFQIAAHENVVPPEKLYEYCRAARKILCGENAVGRVIARPFVGEYPNYERTSNRHDFSLDPTGTTMLDLIKDAGMDVISVGKINDIFAGRGVTESNPITGNADGMEKTSRIAERDFNGLCFVNLVDFDSKYGHRNDVDGYAAAVAEFDEWLGGFLPKMRDGDVLMITADHGCDPATVSTDHSREGIPILVYGKHIKPKNLGTRFGFGNIGSTVCALLGVKNALDGNSFAGEILKYDAEALVHAAETARENSYCPYSNVAVGAALLCADGRVFCGSNIENAAFSPTICAERSAFAAAISAGERDFAAIAVRGGVSGRSAEAEYPPCGVCRQVMREFCKNDFEVALSKDRTVTLENILPHGFTKEKFTK